MPRLEVPLRNIPRQRMVVSSDYADIELTVWRHPYGSWFCSVEAGGIRYLSGKRIVSNGIIHTADMPGYILCVPLHPDDSFEDEEPGVAPWGVTHRLEWVVSGE